jgi:chorismate mutase
MESMNLGALRDSIDKLDREIISLLSQRFQLTEEVGIYKAKYHLNPQDKKRESEKFKELIQHSESYGLNPNYILEIYRCIIDLAILRHQEIKSTN